ncbi:MAG: hypothetical protein ACJ78V_07100 [Myxococcales bacterium]
MDREHATLEKLRASGRTGSAIFATCCVERLRPLLNHVPSGAPPLVAGVALTELWHILEGRKRPDPRRLQELSNACWTLVEIEPVPKVRTEHLEALVAATRDAVETYLSGNSQNAIAAAKKCGAILGEDEPARQDRDVAEIAKAREGLAQLATKMRERAEAEGEKIVRDLIVD